MLKFLNSIGKTKAIGLSFASATAVTTVFYTMLQSTGALDGFMPGSVREEARVAPAVGYAGQHGH